jgi:hypothetical protein
MAKCYKFSITNTATTWVTIGYHNCDSNLVVSQDELYPGQTKYVWAYENTVTSAFQNGYNINNDTLNPPILNVVAETTESTLIVSSPSGSTEYYYTVFNYRTNTSTGLVGLELDNTVWDNWENYPLTNSGYALFFRDNSNNVIIHFMDYTGNIIDTYSANTGNNNYDVLDGKIVYFDDIQNGIMKYFDGKTVRTYTYNSSDAEVYVQWDLDAVTSDNCFVILEYSNSANTDTLKVINGSTVTSFKTIDRNTSQYINDCYIYNNGNFIAVGTYDDGPNGYVNFEFYSTSGTLLETVDLSGTRYTERDIFFYGTNKFGMITWDYYDNNTDYIIASFDGRSNTLLSTTHERGANYVSHNTYSQSNGIGPESYLSESFFITLYHNTAYNNDIYTTDYFDIVKVFDKATSIGVYTFVEDGTAYYANCIELGNNALFFPIYDGENSLTMRTITSSGNVDVNISTGTTYYDYWCSSFGNYSFILPWSGNTNEGGVMYIFNTDGTLFTEVTIDATSGGWNYEITSDIFMYIHNDAGIVKYFNKNKVLTTISGNYDSYETYDSYFKSNFKDESSILIYNNMTGAARIINPRNVSKQFTLPDNLDYSIKVGRNSVMFTYINSSTEFVNIAVYDLDGNLLNNITTTDTTWDDYDELINDRGYVQSWSTNDAVGNIRMITPNLIQFSIVTNVDNAWYTFNDYVWWY